MATSSFAFVLDQDEVTMRRIISIVILGLGVGGVAIFWRGNLSLLGWPRLGGRGALLSGLALAAILALIVTAARQWPWLFMDMTASYRDQDMGLGAALLDISLLPAIGEELLFRGVILTALMGTFSTRTAVVVSSLLFATIHISPLSFAHLAMLGLLLAVVRVRTGSIYPSMLLHGLYNGVLVLADW